MTRVLFVSNGHGEEAIAARIAQALSANLPVSCDHLALVGGMREVNTPGAMQEVGPRRAMPSGGLIAMGNIRNITRDLGAGLVGHTLAQLRFLRSVRGQYAAAIAVGDIFALLMSLRARARFTVFAGTAKSVYVAPYGPLEEAVMRKARAIFVRDAATARRLEEHGIGAQIANVIVDLQADDSGAPLDLPFEPRLVLFPGSRSAAYGDAIALCRIVRETARAFSNLGAVLSIAPGLDALRFRDELAADGWRVQSQEDSLAPFVLFDGKRELIRAWKGPIGTALHGATLVLGQAGTANEAAASGGIPVVAFEQPGRRKNAWYRRRQAGLLGDALLVVPEEIAHAGRAVAELLADEKRRMEMGRVGRERMGPPGGARRIAAAVAELLASEGR